MSKYRIIKNITNCGFEEFYVQRKVSVLCFHFWKDCKDYRDYSDSKLFLTKTFFSKEKAIEWVKNGCPVMKRQHRKEIIEEIEI